MRPCFRNCSDCYLLRNRNKTSCNFNFIGKLDREYTEEEKEIEKDINLLDGELNLLDDELNN